jgi:hypothetical protein
VSKKELPPSKVSKAEEDWMTKKWRPMMAVMYMIACIFDFVLFPIMFTGVQFWETQAANDAFRQWAPITLQGGGLFHVAMGAVLGVSAWSRGQEKMAGAAGGPVAGANNGTLQPVGQSVTTTYSAPQAGNFGNAGGFSAPAPASWGAAPVNNSFGSAGVATGWGGKKAPPEPEYPVIG